MAQSALFAMFIAGLVPPATAGLVLRVTPGKEKPAPAKAGTGLENSGAGSA